MRTRLLRFTQHAADPCVGVLDKRSRIAVKINTLFGIEEHVLARINFENKVFECAKSHFTRNLVCFLLGDVGQGVHLVFTQFFCFVYHTRHQFVGIHHRTLAALHLAVGQFDHAVGEMYEFFAKGETELVQQQGQHLEVVFLLIAYHIDHLVNGIVLEAQFGGADVLCHINAGAVTSEQQFLVQSVPRQVSPYRTVFAAVENALF